MTKTNGIEYNGRCFWAYDVAKGVLLKFLIDCAEDYRRSSLDDCAWLTAAIARWRIEAITCYGVTIDKSWTELQTGVFLKLVDEACVRIERRGAIPAAEAEGWDILDGKGVFARGVAEIEPGPVVELGRAIISLVRGTLPKPPPYTWWLFGSPGNEKTISMTTRTDSSSDKGD